MTHLRGSTVRGTAGRDAGFTLPAGDAGFTLPVGDAGFTLIEALVAMAVLAVAAAGLLRATQGHLDTIGALEARAAAGWAADATLTEARLGLAPAATADVLGRTWRTSVATGRSDDPAIAALTVEATAGGVGASLRGFRDLAPPPAPPAGGPEPAATASPASPPGPGR